MSIKAIANRYASALLSEAVSQGIEEAVQADLVRVLHAADASSDLRMLLRSPIIEWWRKKAIVKEAFADSVRPLTLTFLQLVIEKGRERFYREIIQSYADLLDQRNNVLRIAVASASELDGPTRDRVQQAVATRTGKTVEAVYTVDASLIGGMRIAIGDNVYDGTLQHQLEDLRTRLSAEILN